MSNERLLPERTPRDPADRPPDPAGTRPKHRPEDLRPQNSVPLVHRVGDVDSTAEEEPLGGGDDIVMTPDGAAAVAPGGVRVEPPRAARFQFVLGALLAVGAAVMIGIAALIASDNSTEHVITVGQEWSSWTPTPAGGSGAKQISDHVGREYRLGNGQQLVAVTGGPLEVAGLPLTIALRQPAAQGGNIQLIDGKGVLYRLCGLGPKCAIASGKPSTKRHLLLRREAFELALYSFEYLKGVDQVVVFMPPRLGQDPTQALFFRKSDVQQELDRPLVDTLSPRTPSVANVAASPDAVRVNAVTSARLFQFSLTQANQDARAFLVLDPFDTNPR